MSELLQADAIVVGGGIVGCTAALALRRRGVRVVLLERDYCGSRSSGINFGGVRRQGRPPSQLALAQRAHAIWARLSSIIGIDGEYVRTGHLKLARTPQDMHALEAYAQQTRDYGLGLQLMSGAELARRCPWLAPGLAGASLCPEDGQANPRLVSAAFGRAAQAAGAQVLERTEVIDVQHEGNQFVVLARCHDSADKQAVLRVCAPRLLNCAGAWSLKIARALGDDVPLTAGYPAMAVTEPVDGFIDASLGVQGGDMYCRQVARGNVVMGGGRGLGAGLTSARAHGPAVAEIVRRVTTLIPRLRHVQIIRSWSGVEGYLPDRLPVIGLSPTVSGLVHGFGFCGGGFEIGPAVGEVLCELALDGASPTPIDAFALNRFTRAAWDANLLAAHG